MMGAPLLTSKFGWRKNPLDRTKTEFHPGADLDLPDGTPVMSAHSGRVVTSGYGGEGGNTVAIYNDATRVLMWYGHLQDRTVVVGENVPEGRLIGHLGNTGARSTGGHLHWQAAIMDSAGQSGVLIDPIAYVNGRIEYDPRAGARVQWPKSLNHSVSYPTAEMAAPKNARAGATAPPQSSILSTAPKAAASGATIMVVAAAAIALNKRTSK